MVDSLLFEGKLLCNIWEFDLLDQFDHSIILLGYVYDMYCIWTYHNFKPFFKILCLHPRPDDAWVPDFKETQDGEIWSSAFYPDT